MQVKVKTDVIPKVTLLIHSVYVFISLRIVAYNISSSPPYCEGKLERLRIYSLKVFIFDYLECVSYDMNEVRIYSISFDPLICQALALP